jgi:hypothetical protein
MLLVLGAMGRPYRSNLTMPNNLPSAGTLKLDPRIARAFIAQLEVMAATDHKTQQAAVRRRKRAVAGLDDAQRDYARFVASVISRMCSDVA